MAKKDDKKKPQPKKDDKKKKDPKAKEGEEQILDPFDDTIERNMSERYQKLKEKETYVLLENDLPDIFNEK